jgi:transposase InsO family protein
MAKTIKEERLRWVLPIIKKEIRLVDVAKVCPHGKRSLERWVAAYKRGGEKSLEPKSTEPKHCQGETSVRVKERIIEIRKETKKCAQKIHWQLKREGVIIHPRTIGKILKKEKMVRTYRIKKIIYKYVKAQRQPGELVEIDVKYVPGRIVGKRYFQYTAIDTDSRWRHLEVYEEQNGWNSSLFLERVIEKFSYTIRAVKTDNGFIFTNRYTGTYKRLDMMPKGVHAFDSCCASHNIVHYLIDPGKPAQNGTVERSHREDQEKFYDQNKFKTLLSLQKKMKEWNIYYNNLEHCGLNGQSPNEFLANYSKTNPPNVCT